MCFKWHSSSSRKNNCTVYAILDEQATTLHSGWRKTLQMFQHILRRQQQCVLVFQAQKCLGHQRRRRDVFRRIHQKEKQLKSSIFGKVFFQSSAARAGQTRAVLNNIPSFSLGKFFKGNERKKMASFVKQPQPKKVSHSSFLVSLLPLRHAYTVEM